MTIDSSDMPIEMEIGIEEAAFTLAEAEGWHAARIFVRWCRNHWARTRTLPTERLDWYLTHAPACARAEQAEADHPERIVMVTEHLPTHRGGMLRCGCSNCATLRRADEALYQGDQEG